jgi:hypothetical protein
VLSVIGRLQIDGWDVAAIFVEAAVVEPVGPFGGRQLDFVDAPPGLARSDQLGFIQAVDGFGQGVVIRAANRSDRGLDSGLSETFGEPDRRVLRPSIRMVDNIFKIHDAFLLAGPDRLLDGIEHHRGGHR